METEKKQMPPAATTSKSGNIHDIGPIQYDPPQGHMPWVKCEQSKFTLSQPKRENRQTDRRMMPLGILSGRGHKRLKKRTFLLYCWQGTLTPRDTWARSHFGLAYILLVETNPFPEFVIFPDYSLRTSLGTFSILLQTEAVEAQSEII